MKCIILADSSDASIFSNKDGCNKLLSRGDETMTEQTVELFEEEEDTQKDKYLTFSLGKEIFGIEIKFVTEIIGIQAITEIPQLPPYIKGIINLRGKIIPVMDVRLRFEKEAREYNDRTCVIIVEIREICIGLIVDSVSDVLLIPEENIVPPPDSKLGVKSKYIMGIGKVENDIKLILDCDKLLNDEEVEKLNNII